MDTSTSVSVLSLGLPVACSLRWAMPIRSSSRMDPAGYVQWPDGGFQEIKLTKGEWAGPIAPPEEP